MAGEAASATAVRMLYSETLTAWNQKAGKSANCYLLVMICEEKKNSKTIDFLAY